MPPITPIWVKRNGCGPLEAIYQAHSSNLERETVANTYGVLDRSTERRLAFVIFPKAVILEFDDPRTGNWALRTDEEDLTKSHFRKGYFGTNLSGMDSQKLLPRIETALASLLESWNRRQERERLRREAKVQEKIAKLKQRVRGHLDHLQRINPLWREKYLTWIDEGDSPHKVLHIIREILMAEGWRTPSATSTNSLSFWSSTKEKYFLQFEYCGACVGKQTKMPDGWNWSTPTLLAVWSYPHIDLPTIAKWLTTDLPALSTLARAGE